MPPSVKPAVLHGSLLASLQHHLNPFHLHFLKEPQKNWLANIVQTTYVMANRHAGLFGYLLLEDAIKVVLSVTELL
jgi:hypothetical protein